MNTEYEAIVRRWTDILIVAGLPEEEAARLAIETASEEPANEISLQLLEVA
jgi:hypothetical protein